MAEESSGPSGYIPVPVILEPSSDDDNTEKDGNSRSREDKGQSRNSASQKGESAAAAMKSSSGNSGCSSSNNANSHHAVGGSKGPGNLRRRQQACAGTTEESTPLTLRRCIQNPHGGASPEPGGRSAHGPGAALLSVEEGDCNLEGSNVEGEPNAARRISGCSTNSALSTGANPRSGQHHVVVVATPVRSPACGVPSSVGHGGNDNKNGPGFAQGEGALTDASQRGDLQDGIGDNENHDNNNNNNSNDSEDGEDLLFPGFAPKTFYVLDQKNYFRLMCLRCITWPYPFALSFNINAVIFLTSSIT